MRGKLHFLAICAVAVLVSGFCWQTDGFQRERGDSKTDALKNAVEGKEPPKLVATEWLNSKPLNWAGLKGKVVVLDFWAHW
jgi:hypothetical protein